MKRFSKAYCWVFGHNMISLYTVSNREEGGRSVWGRHFCVRCGKELDWQYDF